MLSKRQFSAFQQRFSDSKPSSPFVCLSTSYRARLPKCEFSFISGKLSFGAKSVAPPFPALRAGGPCSPLRSSATSAEPNAPTGHRKSSLAESDVSGSRQGGSVEANDSPPYRHWHVVCAACGKIALARACQPRREIEPVEHNPVVKCQHCGDTRQYLTNDCFLAPLSVASSTDKSAGALAVVAGLIAAVKLARVESGELQSRSPRVRAAITDSITIAKMVIAEAKTRQ